MAKLGNSASLQGTTDKNADVEAALSALMPLTTQELRTAWRRHFKKEAPKGISRDLLLRAIAHDIQERTYGGLSTATLRRLKTMATSLEKTAGRTTETDPGIKPGTQLVRSWRGTTHTVLVLENGFVYAGERYASLSHIAKVISGLHRSGPAFFGLKRRTAHFARIAAATQASVHPDDET
jgi:hypothetical protein